MILLAKFGTEAVEAISIKVVDTPGAHDSFIAASWPPQGVTWPTLKQAAEVAARTRTYRRISAAGRAIGVISRRAG